MTIEEYRKEFIDELRIDASVNETDTDDVFVQRSIEILEDRGEVTDVIQTYFGKRKRNKAIMQFNAYAFDDADASLILIVSDFTDTYDPENLGKIQLDNLYKRMINFLDEVYFGKISDYCDDSDEVLNIAREIRQKTGNNIVTSSILKYKFFIITNAQLSNTIKSIKKDDYNERPVELNVWTIERYFEIMQASKSEPIEINVQDYGVQGLPFLQEEFTEKLDYDAYLSIVPGKFLADVYLQHGSRLLEGNVRAFLSAKGKVNSGIRNTIIKEPTKFFTYNNGIAATADSVTIENTYNGPRIVKMTDLQIINGGQTTASLANAIIRKDNSLLEGIFVPMKLTIIKSDRTTEENEELYNEMVEQISRCANCQNPVKDADFFSNSPFHITIEKLSKKCMAPPVNGSPHPTIWFYERSRGKWEQEQMKLTKSEKEKFKEKYPKSQRIRKEDFAKYMNTLNCLPHIVAHGSAKNMKRFGEQIEKEYAKSKESYNEVYFKKAICAAIIFVDTDKLINRSSWYPKGGNKAQIVPYTISKIMFSIPEGFTLDYNLIWQKQTMYSSLVHQVEIVAKMTHDFLANSNGIIVREYAKDEKTWKQFQTLPLKLTEEFLKNLVPISEIKSSERQAKKEQKLDNDIADEIKVFNLGAEYWMGVLTQAREKKLINAKEDSLLNVAATMDLQNGRFPSAAQAKRIMQIREEIGSQGIFI